MRIACLQFAPVKGDVQNNLSRADAVLLRADPENLDILVVPELAFSGYNFKSLKEIYPYLEPTVSGISSQWARTTARRYNCTVIAGYPEKVDLAPKWPSGPEYYNAALVVDCDGATAARYRKSHLYSSDESWALEGTSGFCHGELKTLGTIAVGLSTDLNPSPYRSDTPGDGFEFAFHVLEVKANLVIVAMSWLTNEDGRHFSSMPQEPDMNTLMYWVSRLEPIIRQESEDEIIVVFANRAGSEDEFVYAGTSCVLGIRNKEVRVYGILGRCDRELLVVDTDKPPFGDLTYRLEGAAMRSSAAHTFFSVASPGPMPVTESKLHSTKAGQLVDTTDAAVPGTPRGGHASRRIAQPKLSIQTRPEEGAWPYEPMAILTPTHPSPTPHSLRPKLATSPAESMTRRYLDSSFPSPHTLMSPMRSPLHIYGGQVSIAAGAIASPTMKSDTSASPQSPHIACFPHREVARSPVDLWPITPAESDRTCFSEWESEGPRRSSNRNSVDGYILSMYIHGQAVATGSNLSARPANSSGDLVEESSSSPVRPSNTDQDVRASNLPDTLPNRPSAPKSRNASLPPLQQRSCSVNAHSSQGTSTSERAHSPVCQTRPQQHHPVAEVIGDSRQRAWPLGEARSPPSTLTRQLSEDRIPFFGESGPSYGVASNGDKHTARSNHYTDNSSGTGGFARPGARLAFVPNPFRLSTSLPGEMRPLSRGRQRVAERFLDGVPTTEVGNISARHTESARPEPAQQLDLSQFQVIEEYPSPHCPVHGSRSRSGVGRSSVALAILDTQDHGTGGKEARLNRRPKSADPESRDDPSMASRNVRSSSLTSRGVAAVRGSGSLPILEPKNLGSQSAIRHITPEHVHGPRTARNKVAQNVTSQTCASPSNRSRTFSRKSSRSAGASPPKHLPEEILTKAELEPWVNIWMPPVTDAVLARSGSVPPFSSSVETLATPNASPPQTPPEGPLTPRAMVIYFDDPDARTWDGAVMTVMTCAERSSDLDSRRPQSAI